MINNYTNQFVAAAVSHMHHTMTTPDPDPDVYPAITMFVTVGWMGRVKSFSETLPYVRLVPTIVTFIRKVAQSPFEESKAAKTLRCFNACLEFFLMASHCATDLTWLVRLLDLGVLEGFLLFKPWLLWGSNRTGSLQEMDNITNFLRSVLCPYLVYPRILRSAARSLRRLARRPTYAVENELGHVKPTWVAMEKTISNYMSLLDRLET